jgi:ferritin
MNAQIGNELGASNQYLQIAAYFEGQALKKLAKLFVKQAEEERTHAMKFFAYLNEVGAPVSIAAIPAPKYDIGSAEKAFEMAVAWEKEVTTQVYAMVDLAIKERDYASQNFLQWFVTEQVEEEKSAAEVVEQLKAVGESKASLMLLDRHLGKRSE